MITSSRHTSHVFCMSLPLAVVTHAITSSSDVKTNLMGRTQNMYAAALAHSDVSSLDRFLSDISMNMCRVNMFIRVHRKHKRPDRNIRVPIDAFHIVLHGMPFKNAFENTCSTFSVVDPTSAEYKCASVGGQ